MQDMFNGSVKWSSGAERQYVRSAPHWGRIEYEKAVEVKYHETELDAQRSALGQLRANMREDLNRLDKAAEALDRIVHGT